MDQWRGRMLDLRKYYVIIVVCLLISGCMNSSESTLKTGSSSEDIVIIKSQKNYEEVYQIIASNAKGCWRQAEGSTRRAVDSTLDSNNKIGKVAAYSDYLAWGKDYVVSAEITPVETGSQIKLYKKESFAHRGEFAEMINAWLRGESKCSKSAFFVLY